MTTFFAIGLRRSKHDKTLDVYYPHIDTDLQYIESVLSVIDLKENSFTMIDHEQKSKLLNLDHRSQQFLLERELPQSSYSTCDLIVFYMKDG